MINSPSNLHSNDIDTFRENKSSKSYSPAQALNKEMDFNETIQMILKYMGF